MNSNNIKDSLLGIPHGTANNKLRKMIIFSLVQELNKDTCYRCNLKIETVKEFSIEHKSGWQLARNPLEAFFDLEQIGFSHLQCNIKAAIRNIGEFQRKKTHCSKGHEYNIRNTYIDKNMSRHCNLCRNIRMKNIRELRKLSHRSTI